MKQLFALVLAALTTFAQAWDQRAPLPVEQCQVHSPYGWAQTQRQATPICREAYLVAYDAPVKIPVYVAYTTQLSEGTEVFHNDIRAYGKDFERFYERARHLAGVRFERSYVSIGREIPETKNVTIRYATDGEGVREEAAFQSSGG